MNKYIIHYPKLTERKKYIECAINELKISNVSFISNYNRTDGETALYNNDIKYLPDEKIWIEKSKNYYIEIPRFRILSLGEISCGLNHMHAWKKIATNGDGLILEDDVIFCKNFEQIFNQIVIDKPNDLDVLFIGGGFHHEHVAKTVAIKNNFYKKYHPSTNTVCAYLLTQRAAQKLCLEAKNHTMPIDFEMNYLFDKLNFNIYHHIPYIVKVGSSIGVYQSSNR